MWPPPYDNYRNHSLLINTKRTHHKLCLSSKGVYMHRWQEKQRDQPATAALEYQSCVSGRDGVGDKWLCVVTAGSWFLYGRGLWFILNPPTSSLIPRLSVGPTKSLGMRLTHYQLPLMLTCCAYSNTESPVIF